MLPTFSFLSSFPSLLLSTCPALFVLVFRSIINIVIVTAAVTLNHPVVSLSTNHFIQWCQATHTHTQSFSFTWEWFCFFILSLTGTDTDTHDIDVWMNTVCGCSTHTETVESQTPVLSQLSFQTLLLFYSVTEEPKMFKRFSTLIWWRGTVLWCVFDRCCDPYLSISLQNRKEVSSLFLFAFFRPIGSLLLHCVYVSVCVYPCVRACACAAELWSSL